MRVLHSKHQKLILQCYPPGKGVDKRPNPLELSYLLYYASTRRVKLEKVIDFLRHKTKTDARGSKSGNLQVTLAIVLALIDKCPDNLNAFALQVCSILLTILHLHELPLCKTLVRTYGVLCSKLDNGLFTGDKDFVDLFTQLTLNMISTADAQLKVETTNTNEWRMIALLTSRHVFHCLAFNPRISRTYLAICVPLLILTVRLTTSNEALLTRLNSNLNVERGNEKRLSYSVTNRTAAHLSNTAKNFDENAVTEDDLTEEAFFALRALFNTNLSSQISDATREVVENDFRVSSGTASAWGTNFLEMCASWVPVQLRFIALLTLLNRLSITSDQANRKSNNYAHIKHFAKYLLSLVSSDFNMIGLSISDIIQQLLNLQTNLHLSLADYLSKEEVNDLSNIYSQCVCNLSSHIYYFDQVADSIEGILMQIDSVLIAANSSTVRIHKLVLTLLDTIAIILKLLARKTSSIARNHATLENWDISFQLLTFAKSYTSYSESASAEQVSSIQKKYLDVFNSFLNSELTKGDERSQEDVMDSNADWSSKFLVPNYNEYIKHKENALASVLVRAHDYFDDASFDLGVTAQLVSALVSIEQIMGVNFFHNFLPFFEHWQAQDTTTSIHVRARDTAAYIIIRKMIDVLESKYADSLETNVRRLRLNTAINNDIKSRQSTGFWVYELDSPQTSREPTGEFTNEVSAKLLYGFFAETSLNQWISAQSSIVFDVPNGNASADGKADGYGGLVLEQYQVSRSNPQGSGFGLGNANDITSIYSGLLTGRQDSGVTPDASHITADTIPTISSLATQDQNNYKFSLMPRVEDLKQSVNGLPVQDEQFSFKPRTGTSPRSVLQKQIHTTDVDSILNGLKSDDDNEIVV